MLLGAAAGCCCWVLLLLLDLVCSVFVVGTHRTWRPDQLWNIMLGIAKSKSKDVE